MGGRSRRKKKEPRERSTARRRRRTPPLVHAIEPVPRSTTPTPLLGTALLQLTAASTRHGATPIFSEPHGRHPHHLTDDEP